MRRSSLITSVLVLAILVAGVVLIARNREFIPHTTQQPATRSYVNEPYGYSFSYPSSDVLNEYDPRYVGVSDTGSTTDELAEVSIETGTDATVSYDVFVHSAAARYCAADGPAGSMRCIGVARSEPYTSAKGLSGEVFYLTLQTSMNGTTSTRESGPYYAFNIGVNVPDAVHAALLVRLTHPAEESTFYDQGAALAKEIVDSLRISKVAP